MRAALWLMALFAIAVASALFAGNNDATVTVFWEPHRIDLSLNFVLLILGAQTGLVIWKQKHKRSYELVGVC